GPACDGDERPGVGAQDAQPAGEVRGVVGAGHGRQSHLGAPHGGAELGDELFGGVAVRSEPTVEVPLEAVGVTGPVDVLVGERAGVEGGVVELGEVGDVDGVGCGLVAGAVATVDDLGAHGGEVGVGG